MRGGVATIVSVIALVTAGVAAAGTTQPIVIGDVLHVDFSFGIGPSKLPKKKPQPRRLSFSSEIRTEDGSHVPALSQVEFKLDRHFHLAVRGIPVCPKGTLDERREVLEGCEDAVVGRGTIEAEVAFPEQPLIAVTGRLTIYNRGRKPGGLDLLGWAFFPAPDTGTLAVLVKVRKIEDGRYGWRARLEIPKLAGGYGSITGYSAVLSKRITSVACPDGKLQASAASTFVDGTVGFLTAIRTCTVAEADSRQ